MKKLYISEINSVYFYWPERNKNYILSTKCSLNRTQSLKSWQSLTIIFYFLNPSLLAKHTPLITTASPGNYENPPRINQMQKNGNQKYTVRHLIVALQFYQIPRTLWLGKERNPCEVLFNWAISRLGFSKFGNLKLLESKMAFKFLYFQDSNFDP